MRVCFDPHWDRFHRSLISGLVLALQRFLLVQLGSPVVAGVVHIAVGVQGRGEVMVGPLEQENPFT